jgi:hypothetical protein
MPKEFYTEKDIEDMFKRGIMSLEVNDNVVLTGMAYEKAASVGMKLVRDKADNPPNAPVRPYISKMQRPLAVAAGAPPGIPATPPCPSAGEVEAPDLQKRIREAVFARLGDQVDSSMLEVIIRRVLASTGVK